MLLSNRFLFTSSLLAATALLVGCSDDDSVVVLDARPSVSLDVPDFLLDDNSVNQEQLFPTIALSNGANVSMQQVAEDVWSGTINVEVDASYTATIVWVEFFNGQDLPLAQTTQDITVAADGSITRGQALGYSIDIDTDGDGAPNLQERRANTDPFNQQDNGVSNEPVDAAASENPSAPTENELTPAEDEPTSNPETDSDLLAVQQPSSDPEEPTGSFDSEETTGSSEDEQLVDNTDSTPASDNVDSGVEDNAGSDTDTSVEPDEDSESESTPIVADVIVPRIALSAAPSIDGENVTLNSLGALTGEWAAAVQVDSSGAPLIIDNLIVDINAETLGSTPFRRWAAMHDGTYLYIVVMVDDVGQRNRDSSSELAQDDSLELFIDGDNSKSQSYDSNDFHRLIPVQLAGPDKQSANSGDQAGTNSSDASLVLDFATGPGIGPDGVRIARFEQDIYEIRVGLESAGIDENAAFGFELQINDDDNGGQRESKWAWKLTATDGQDIDETQRNPSLMGTLALE